jgi:hypothetical protein
MGAFDMIPAVKSIKEELRNKQNLEICFYYYFQWYNMILKEKDGEVDKEGKRKIITAIKRLGEWEFLNSLLEFERLELDRGEKENTG